MAVSGDIVNKWEDELWASMYGKVDSPYYAWKSFKRYLCDEMRIEDISAKQVAKKKKQVAIDSLAAKQEQLKQQVNQLSAVRNANGATSAAYQACLGSVHGNVSGLLTVTSGPHKGENQTFQLEDWRTNKNAKFTIGRGGRNLCLRLDPQVSLYHGEITRVQDELHLENCGDTTIVVSGTMLHNGMSLKLFAGNVIHLGQSMIRFQLQETKDQISFHCTFNKCECNAFSGTGQTCLNCRHGKMYHTMRAVKDDVLDKVPTLSVDVCKQMLSQLDELDITPSEMLMLASSQGQHQSVNLLLQRSDVAVNDDTYKEEWASPLVQAVMMPRCMCADCYCPLVKANINLNRSCTCFEPEKTIRYEYVVPPGIVPGKTKITMNFPGDSSKYVVHMTEKHVPGQTAFEILEKSPEKMKLEKKEHSEQAKTCYFCPKCKSSDSCERCLLNNHQNYVATVRVLMDNGIDVNNSPLAMVTAIRSIFPYLSQEVEQEFISLFLNHPNIDVNQSYSEDFFRLAGSPLHTAAFSSELATRLLVNHPNIQLEKQDYQGKTPLYAASLCTHASKNIPSSVFSVGKSNMDILLSSGAKSEGQLFVPVEGTGVYESANCQYCVQEVLSKKYTENDDEEICDLCGRILLIMQRKYTCEKCKFTVCGKCKIVAGDVSDDDVADSEEFDNETISLFQQFSKEQCRATIKELGDARWKNLSQKQRLDVLERGEIEHTVSIAAENDLNGLMVERHSSEFVLVCVDGTASSFFKTNDQIVSIGAVNVEDTELTDGDSVIAYLKQQHKPVDLILSRKIGWSISLGKKTVCPSNETKTQSNLAGGSASTLKKRRTLNRKVTHVANKMSTPNITFRSDVVAKGPSNNASKTKVVPINESYSAPTNVAVIKIESSSSIVPSPNGNTQPSECRQKMNKVGYFLALLFIIIIISPYTFIYYWYYYIIATACFFYWLFKSSKKQPQNNTNPQQSQSTASGQILCYTVIFGPGGLGVNMYRRPDKPGCFVHHVVEHSQASQNNVRVNDKIVAVGNVLVNDPNQVTLALTQHPRPIILTFHRGF